MRGLDGWYQKVLAIYQNLCGIISIANTFFTVPPSHIRPKDCPVILYINADKAHHGLVDIDKTTYMYLKPQELDVEMFSLLVYPLRSRGKDGHFADAQIVSG